MKTHLYSCFTVFILACLTWVLPVRSEVPINLKPVSLNLGGFNYYSSGPFANTALTGGGWLEYSTGWGTAVNFYNTDGTINPQFDANGLPKYLKPGLKLRLLLWPYNVNTPGVSFWPARGNEGIGKWVVTWQGDADIKLNGATFIASESSGPATGRLINGRRVYNMPPSQPSGHIVVDDINAAAPITDLKVWMPNPANPQNQSLEGQFWHPTFLNYLGSIDFNHLRFMDWGCTNGSPQQDWVDRRTPGFSQQQGLLNRRIPAAGMTGDRATGIAYEYMVSLGNATGKDIWINVPHLATDDYITKLAQLICFGSDGTNPYTSPQTNPIYPPLNPSLKVWVEYSNEIWSSGGSFPQGNWASAQATALGITKEQFIARRYARIWQIFQQQFGDASRVVRVAGIFTGTSTYTVNMLTELKNYGATLTPPVSVDAIAPTVYFGNGIQDWVYEQANLNRGKSTQWFHTNQDFTSGSLTRPVSVPITDPYWTSSALSDQELATFAEWKKRIFSGSTAAGGGPDSTGDGGGFSSTLRSDLYTIFGQRLPIVAYEGGPSLYTNYLDAGDVRDDGVTNFIVALNRRPEFAEIYRIQLNMARAKGLQTDAMFNDTSMWSKNGQWGHLEFADQAPSQSAKWKAVSDWATDMSGILPIDQQSGTRPTFITPGTLNRGAWQVPYAQNILISASGTFNLAVIGSLLDPGLTFAPIPDDSLRFRVSGTPQSSGWNYLYLRVSDDSGNASWQIYSFYIAGGPGTLLEADISGSFSGASSLPWTKNMVLDPNVTWTGLNIGATYIDNGGSAIGTDGRGVQLFADTDGIRFAVSQGSSSSTPSTLASAITDNEYWKFTVTPQPGQPLNLRNVEFRLNWLRERYYAPTKFTVFTTVGGFAESQQIYTNGTTPAQNAVAETVFRLPNTAAYESITTPVEFRIYFYGSQYAHQARLLGLKLTHDPSYP